MRLVSARFQVGPALVGVLLLLAGVASPNQASAALRSHATGSTTTTTTSSFCALKTCTSTLVKIPEAAKGGITPVAPAGATDLYRCTFFDPHLTADQMVIGSTFHPQNHGTAKKPVIEIHHAILFQVPSNQVAAVKALGTSWPCFSGPTPADTFAELSNFRSVAGWAPGSASATRPAGYGVNVPAGSGFILQLHYNLLASKAKDNSSWSIDMTPTAESGLTPLLGWSLVAPPDLPCPSGSSGTLCNRTNSLNDLSKRFGSSAVNFVNLIEYVCKAAASTAGDTHWQSPTSTSCIWRRPANSQPITVHTIGAHMHLLGKTLSVELCHSDKTCTDPSKVVGLFVQSYNFDDQRAYNVPPTVINPGDYVKVTCTDQVMKCASRQWAIRKVPVPESGGPAGIIDDGGDLQYRHPRNCVTGR
ncbi:MAG: hypothetical protein NTY27_07605 [Actinobacteria bacterium]|nr:hypothetical protein [Actinomycetota bacterium]